MEGRIGPEFVEAGLRAAFARKAEPESIPGLLGTGSVLLRNAPEEASPRPQVRASGGEAIDDRRYQVVGEIARGGVGIILESRDKDLAREVALKVLRPEYAENPEVVERFVEEAQVGGQLQHPGIVPVYGLGLQPDGRPYFAMKLVRGRTLAAILAERENTKEERRHLLGIFEQICQTVAYAHARGVIHRDLKPSNVMIGAFGEVQVVDWGFAKVLSGERAQRAEPPDETAPAPKAGPGETIVATVRTGDGSSHSVAGSVMGTPAYMPPEQAMGRVDEVDERADVFTLGGILCEILTGRPPYAGQPNEMLMSAAQGGLEDARRRLDGCGAEEDLIELAKRCLAKSRDERPRDAGEVASAIHGCLAAAEERTRKMEMEAAEERAKEVEEEARLARQVAEAKQEEARVARERREAERERARQKEERKRAEFERKARTRSLAVAAALLVAVVVGIGGLLWSQAEASDRAKEVGSRVSAALQQANELEGKGQLSEALAAAKGALNVARDADPKTLEHVRAVVAHIERSDAEEKAAAKRRKEDAELLAGWLSSVREFGYGENDARLIALFLKHGIDVTDPESAAARVLASERRVEIGAVLDAWAWARRTMSELKGTDWKALVRIAEKGDPDELRNRIRAAVASDVAALPAIVADVEKENPPPQTRVLLGEALYAAGRHLEAIDVLRKAARAHPGSAEAHQWLGLTLNTIEPPRTQEAARHGAAMIALRPGNDLARLFGAFLSGDYTTAVRICDAILAEDPANLYAQTERAGALLHMGDWKLAVPAFRRVVEQSPRNVYAWIDLAKSLYRSGDLAGALAVARDSEGVLPSTPEVRAFQLGALSLYLAMTGKHEQSIHKAREAVEAAPDAGFAYRCLGRVLRQAGHAAEAADALRKAIELEPSADAHVDLALILQDTDPAAALAHLRKAVALDPNQAEDQALLAAFHLWQRADPDSALRVASEALRIDGNNAQGWNVLASCHWLKGDIDSYERYARQIEGLNPASAAADLHMGLVATERRDHAAALTWARKALAQADATPDCHGYLGSCLMRVGKFTEGLVELRVCIEQEPPEGADNRYRAEFRDRVTELIDVCERVAPLAAQRDAITRGEIEPEGPAQAAAFGDLCYYAGAFDRATVLYRQAALADRYGRERAAYAAAQSGPEGRARALEILRGELKALGARDNVAGPRHILWDWKRAPLLAPVRDPLPLARLPDAEREGWVPFWTDVDALLARPLGVK